MIIPLLHSISIRTDQREESYEFYTRVLGLHDFSFMFDGSGGASWLSRGDLLIELQYVPDDEMAPPDPIASGICRLTLAVADMDTAAEWMSEHDVKVVSWPQQADPYHERYMSVQAPEGTLIQLREPPLVPRPGLEPGTH